jgi:hypothetical protein
MTALREVLMDFIGLGVLLVLTLVFAFLAQRSWRAQRLWVKLLASISTTLMAMFCVAGVGLAAHAYSKLNRTYTKSGSGHHGGWDIGADRA